MKLVVMQGIPGSGKSTLAAKLVKDYLDSSDKGSKAGAYSTDDFWYDMNGVYRYDIALAGEAHRWNQRRVIQAMQKRVGFIVVDNTNIQKWQAQVYFTLADVFCYEKSVVSVQVPIEVAIQRNAERAKDRAVPEEILRRMHADLEPLI